MQEKIKYIKNPDKENKKLPEKPKTPKWKELEKKTENIKKISSEWRKLALNNLKEEINKPINNNENIKLPKVEKKEKEIQRIKILIWIICHITWFEYKELCALIQKESDFNNWKNWINWKWLTQLTSIAIDDFKERWLSDYKKFFEDIPNEFIQKMRCSSETKLALTKLKTRPDLDKQTYNKLLAIILKEQNKSDVNLLLWSIHLWLKNKKTWVLDDEKINKMAKNINRVKLEDVNKSLRAKNIPQISQEEFKDIKEDIINWKPHKYLRLRNYNWNPQNQDLYPISIIIASNEF